ncbi:MAG: XF1762 family protein [Phycisphaerales bacterium]
MSRLVVKPIELREANAFVAMHHRHHKPVVGHRFSLACYEGDRLCGVAISGRPVARKIDQLAYLEVSRLCTDGTKNACSKLYAAVASAAKSMGYEAVQTYILDSETGTSLKAAGWKCEGKAGGGEWSRKSRPDRRTDQPSQTKLRWRRYLRGVA